jgi:hypothetical protein
MITIILDFHQSLAKNGVFSKTNVVILGIFAQISIVLRQKRQMFRHFFL